MKSTMSSTEISSTERKSIYQWACEYCGDPASHEIRGEVIFGWLRELGLEPQHKVLDIGCGALSQGAPLIRYLNEANYAGIDPNGWLIEAALQEYPDLEQKHPRFLYRSDFDASQLKIKFDMVVAHSVLSHAAHYQMEQALSAVRRVVDEETIWLASVRLDQYNSYDKQWVYPGVSTFRLQTLMALGYHIGWQVKHIPEYQERLVAVAPNDVHDWVQLTAMLSAEEINCLRLEDDEQQRKEQQAAELEATQYRREMDRQNAVLQKVERPP